MECMHAISLLHFQIIKCACAHYIVCLIKCLSILAIMGWDHQNLKVHAAQLQVSNNYGCMLNVFVWPTIVHLYCNFRLGRMRVPDDVLISAFIGGLLSGVKHKIYHSATRLTSQRSIEL